MAGVDVLDMEIYNAVNPIVINRHIARINDIKGKIEKVPVMILVERLKI